MSDEKIPRDEFHKHLDDCEQCRNNPMRLCKSGERLLKKAGSPGPE